MTPAERAVRDAVERRGPIPFAEVVELALYDADGGFYATGGQAGRRGDFLTSPEVGPLFGAVVARALDAWWAAAGPTRRVDVVEAGAGPGTLARTVLAAAPRARRRCATCSSSGRPPSGAGTPSTCPSRRRRRPSPAPRTGRRGERPARAAGRSR